jgi:hypothetical protein
MPVKTVLVTHAVGARWNFLDLSDGGKDQKTDAAA